MKKVCYILSYYSPNYVRTQTLVGALRLIDEITLLEARNQSIGLFRYFETIYKLLLIRIFKNPEYYLLGFRGHEIFWIVRLITLGKVLIFDEMMSPYDSLVFENERIQPDKLLGRFLYAYEKWILNQADLILTDTIAHKEFLEKEFRVSIDKIMAVPVGTNEELFICSPKKVKSQGRKFSVLFYGSFLPLHGFNVILDSAKQLKNLPIQFIMIGGNRVDLTNFFERISSDNLDNIKYIPWVDFKKLPAIIDTVDVGLAGPFGNTGQANRVITGKTYQFLAMGKPVIVGKTMISGEFVDKKNCILVEQGDPKSLSDAITWTYNHQEILPTIGLRGRDLYFKNFSLKQIRECLLSIMG